MRATRLLRGALIGAALCACLPQGGAQITVYGATGSSGSGGGEGGASSLTELSDVSAKRGGATVVQMAQGAVVEGNCAEYDADGDLVDAGDPCGGSTTLDQAAVTGVLLYPEAEAFLDPDCAVTSLANNTSQPLSGCYATLGEAQAFYPSATALTQEFAWAAIQKAIEAADTAGGGTVMLRAGIYRLGDSTLDIGDKRSVNLAGVGRSIAWLRYDGDGAAIQIGERGVDTFYNIIRDLQVNLVNAGANAIGISISQTHHTTIENVLIGHPGSLASQVGVRADGEAAYGSRLVLNDVRIAGSFLTGVHLTGDGAGNGYHASHILGGAVLFQGPTNTGSRGIWMERGDTNLLLNPDVENAEVGIDVDGSFHTITARTESNTVVGLRVDGSSNRVLGGTSADGFEDNGSSNSFFAVYDGSTRYTDVPDGMSVGDVAVALEGHRVEDQSSDCPAGVPVVGSGAGDADCASATSATPLIFEGATADAFETTLAVEDPTADRTVTLHDEHLDFAGLTVAADCASITPARGNQSLCVDSDDDAVYVCRTADGACDTSGEWVQVGSSGGGGSTAQIELDLADARFPDDSAGNERALLDAACSSAAAPTPCWHQLLYESGDSALWQGTIPEGYGTSVTVELLFKMATATTGNTAWDARILCVTPGDAQDVDTDAFAASNATADNAVPDTTAGRLDSQSIALTNDDGCATGDFFALRIERVAASVSDASGAAELTAARLKYTVQ